MAKKGQKFNKYTPELKIEILKKHFEELVPLSALTKEYGISRKTIENWITKKNKGKDIFVDNRQFSSGRPKKNPEEIDYKERYEILKKFQDFIIARREKK